MHLNWHNLYDCTNATFMAGLAGVQLVALYRALSGGKNQQPDPFLWTIVSLWGLFSLSMYLYLDFWLSFVATVACVGSNIGLVLLAILHEPNKEILEAFDEHPRMWEGRVYFNKKDKKMYVATEGQWVG